jgi:micrococcal nuclease
VRVHDGDTLTVLIDYTQLRVRLIDIDAPELGQASGSARGSRSPLPPHAGRRHVRRVYTNAEQVRRGMARVYVRYAPKNSPLYRLEAAARTERRGLWGDPHPVAPWEWRR